MSDFFFQFFLKDIAKKKPHEMQILASLELEKQILASLELFLQNSAHVVHFLIMVTSFKEYGAWNVFWQKIVIFRPSWYLQKL